MINTTHTPNTTMINLLDEGSYNPRQKGDFGFEELLRISNSLESIGLEEMDRVALLNRIDTKYALTIQQLTSVLEAVQHDYRVLEVNGERMTRYRNLYFDTNDFDLYYRHVNGSADRYKVRSREYTNSHRYYLEVKHKTPKDRTIKNRLSTSGLTLHMNSSTADWMHRSYPYDCDELEPKLWNTFNRMTLVSKCMSERVTLDIDLVMYRSGKVVRLPGLAIAEVKVDACCKDSVLLRTMRDMKIHTGGFSKYCIGVALLYEEVKKNNLKPKLKQIEKITGERYYD